MLQRLERTDRLSELLANLCVVDRLVARSPRPTPTSCGCHEQRRAPASDDCATGSDASGASASLARSTTTESSIAATGAAVAERGTANILQPAGSHASSVASSRRVEQ
jgi:hypothetical protein